MNKSIIPSIVLLGLAGLLTSHGELLVYEPFDYAPGADFAGSGGGTGFAPGSTWNAGTNTTGQTVLVMDGDGSDGEIWDGDFDGVTQTGNFAGCSALTAGNADHIWGDRALDPGVTATFTDGATTWFSFIAHSNGQGFYRPIAAIGADVLREDRAKNADGQNLGMGAKFNTSAVRAQYWDDPGGDGNFEQFADSSTGTIGNGSPQFLIAKIVWSDAGMDSLTVARFSSGDTIDESAFDAASQSTVMADLDQSVFDVLNFHGARYYIDELRIATTFDDAVNGTAGTPRQPLEITRIDYHEGSDQITLTWKSNPGETYGLYWSDDLPGFAPGVDPEIPADLVENRTAYGPFDNPSPGSDSLFLRVGPPDLEDPTLVRLWGNNTTVSLEFSEAMHPDAATNPANFTVQNEDVLWPIPSATLSPDGRTITLTLGSSLAIGTPYTVTILNLTDLAGRPLGNPTVGNFQTWDDDPTGIKVFILAGQSNMVGHGKSELGNDDNGDGSEDPGAIGSLRYLAVNDTANYGHLLVDPGNPATSAWATRSDVKVWWRDSDVGAARAVLKGDLGIGFAQSRNSAWFGPEYAFGWILGDYYTEPVLLIKTSWGGKNLHVDFRPPSAVAARGGVVGPYYTGMIDYVRDVLSDLGTEFPVWSGMGYQIAGFGWHQGWNDRINATFAAAYEDNLVDLINDLRAEFGRPDLPISIGTTGMVPPGTDQSPVEAAQLAVADPAQHSEFDGTVFTVDTRPFWRDASVSPSNFGFHWNHNGESHYLIGKSMGDGMVDLLTP